MTRKINKDLDLQVIDFRYDEGFRGRVESDIVSTITTKSSGFSGIPMLRERESSMNNLRIRKLTPSECLKLMGFTYEDYEAMKQVGLSDSAIYHCAGDSIVVPVLMAIFNQFKDENTHKQIIYDYVNDDILKGGQL